MNKKEAIVWCNANFQSWPIPISTKCPAPEDWNWFVLCKPYCKPCYYLANPYGAKIVHSDYFMD